VNWIGFRTLLAKETRRFFRVPGQTLAQPVVTTTLYFLVFGYALGGRVREIDGVPYLQFIVPGLVMLALIQNSFLNSASSMFIAKVQGTIVDLLVAPLGPLELVLAFTLGAVVRGFVVAGTVWIVGALFTGVVAAHPLWMFVFALLVAATFGLIGLAVAIWSNQFEHLNIIPTFVITPLTFLGGVFYSAQMLPGIWAKITRANPILYMVQGLRYGMLGGEHAPWPGLALTAALFVAALSITWWMLASGYKLRG